MLKTFSYYTLIGILNGGPASSKCAKYLSLEGTVGGFWPSDSGVSSIFNDVRKWMWWIKLEMDRLGEKIDTKTCKKKYAKNTDYIPRSKRIIRGGNEQSLKDKYQALIKRYQNLEEKYKNLTINYKDTKKEQNEIVKKGENRSVEFLYQATENKNQAWKEKYQALKKKYLNLVQKYVRPVPGIGEQNQGYGRQVPGYGGQVHDFGFREMQTDFNFGDLMRMPGFGFFSENPITFQSGSGSLAYQCGKGGGFKSKGKGLAPSKGGFRSRFDVKQSGTPQGMMDWLAENLKPASFSKTPVYNLGQHDMFPIQTSHWSSFDFS